MGGGGKQSKNFLYRISSCHVFVKALFQKEDESDSGGDDNDGSTDHFNTKKARTQLQRCDRQGGVNSSLPDTFQTSHLLFYERFKAYQDFMLGNYRPTDTILHSRVVTECTGCMRSNFLVLYITLALSNGVPSRWASTIFFLRSRLGSLLFPR